MLYSFFGAIYLGGAAHADARAQAPRGPAGAEPVRVRGAAALARVVCEVRLHVRAGRCWRLSLFTSSRAHAPLSSAWAKTHVADAGSARMVRSAHAS